jgi:hypothetical protein
MTSGNENLGRLLQEIAEEVDPASTVRVQENLRRRRVRGRRLALAFGAGAAAVAVSVGALNAAGVLGGGRAPTAAQEPISLLGDGSPGDSLPVGQPGEPCPMAEHATSAEALDTRVPRWTPRGDKLTDAWTCGDTPVLLYGDIEISYESGYADLHPESHFEALAKEYGGEVQTLLGRPAWVFSATSSELSNGVEVIVGDIMIRVLAKSSVPIDDLVSMTDRLAIPASERR